MSLPLVYRQGRMFKINQELLPAKAKSTITINQMYVAIFKEFSGAIHSDKYKNLTNQEKMEKICQFADNWLVENKYK